MEGIKNEMPRIMDTYDEMFSRHEREIEAIKKKVESLECNVGAHEEKISREHVNQLRRSRHRWRAGVNDLIVKIRVVSSSAEMMEAWRLRGFLSTLLKMAIKNREILNQEYAQDMEEDQPHEKCFHL